MKNKDIEDILNKFYKYNLTISNCRFFNDRLIYESDGNLYYYNTLHFNTPKAISELLSSSAKQKILLGLNLLLNEK